MTTILNDDETQYTDDPAAVAARCVNLGGGDWTAGARRFAYRLAKTGITTARIRDILAAAVSDEQRRQAYGVPADVDPDALVTDAMELYDREGLMKLRLMHEGHAFSVDEMAAQLRRPRGPS